jgi:hypothetical protein
MKDETVAGGRKAVRPVWNAAKFGRDGSRVMSGRGRALVPSSCTVRLVVTSGESMKLIARLVSLAFLFIGVVSLILGILAVSRGRSSRSWPTVDGAIVASTLEVSSRRNPQRGTHRDLYSARVEYAYEVEGRPYSGRTVRYGVPATTDRAAAQQTLGRYSAGAPVQVYYDPRDPSRAVLEPGVARSSYGPIWIALPFLIVGGTFTLLTFRYGDAIDEFVERALQRQSAGRQGEARRASRVQKSR